MISNCVINLSGDKPRVIAEAARVLRPGGRFAVSDVIADEDMDEATRADMRAVDRLHRRRAHARRVRARADRRRPRRHRDPRDAPRARARRVGDHPRAQAASGTAPGRGRRPTSLAADAPSPSLSLLCLAALLALAGCGSSSSGDNAAAPAKPSPAVAGAEKPEGADFPDTAGKTLQEVADGVNSGPQVGLATATFVPGTNRVAFGMIGADNAFLYGPTALYFAQEAQRPRPGPVPRAA